MGNILSGESFVGSAAGQIIMDMLEELLSKPVCEQEVAITEQLLAIVGNPSIVPPGDHRLPLVRTKLEALKDFRINEVQVAVSPNSGAQIKEHDGVRENADSMRNEWESRDAESRRLNKLLTDELEKIKAEIIDSQCNVHGWMRMSLHFQTQVEELSCQISSAKSQQVARIAQLENRCEDLLKQLICVESRKGKEATASGLYVDTEATPQNLRAAVEHVRSSVQIFGRELMKFTNTEQRQEMCNALLNEKGVMLTRDTDFRFWLQAHVVEVAFGHARNWDRRFLLQCLPLSSNISEVQQHYFSRYLMLLTDADNILTKLAKPDAFTSSIGQFRICKQTCAADRYCSCGASELECFCERNIEALQRMNILQLVALDAVPRLLESFTAFLLNVWLLHLLALAFEQPACIFEVEGGQEFVDSAMENAVMQEENHVLGAVEFMIIPGFRVGRTVIKSLVYLAEWGEANQFRSQDIVSSKRFRNVQ